MRLWVILMCLVTPAFGQTIDVKGASPSETPMYRPILLGKGPTALVNRINTDKLVKDGQKDGLVMFSCFVNKAGKMVVSAVYRPTPNLFQRFIITRRSTRFTMVRSALWS